MPIDTNQVQRDFISQAVRPTIERLIVVRTVCQAFVDDYDNQSDPISTAAQVINDANDGVTPRDDAPNITGAQLSQLRNFCNNIATQIDSTAYNTLVQLAVRDLVTIIKNQTLQ